MEPSLSHLVLLGLLGCAETPRPPDVVLITADTLRADRLGFMGDRAAHTPALDALAARARVFTQATTPLPRTTPALASVLTGLWPHHHGAREVGDPIERVPTLAALLGGRGYTAVAVSAMRVAGPEQGLDQGFDRFVVDHDARASAVTAQALDLVAGVRGPLFLWVHYADPHFPYLPEDPDPAAPDCRALGRGVFDGGVDRVALMANRDGVAAAAADGCAALYAGEVSAVDAAVGALLAGLEARGPALQVFTADHGEHLGERGLYYEHGPSVHDAALRVPLLVAGPGVVPGSDAGVARLEDLAPTVLGWLGVEPPAMDGADLGPRLRGEPGGPTVAPAESGSALQLRLTTVLVSGRRDRWCLNAPRWSWCARRGGRGLYDRDADPDLRVDVAAVHPAVAAALGEAATRWAPEAARERAVRTARFKLVGRPQLAGGYRWSLYDLVDDPGERVDVAAAHPDRVATLRAALDDWPPLREAAVRSPETLEALRALGYVAP